MRALATVLVVFAILLITPALQAAILTYDSSSPGVYFDPEGAPPPGSGNFCFQQFNPSLGTLDSITINLQGWCNINYYLGGQGSGASTCTLTMGTQDPAGNLSSQLVLSQTQSFVLDNNDNFRVQTSNYGSGSSQTTYTSKSVLGEFTGIGDIELPGTYNIGIKCSTPGSAGASLYDRSFALDGSVTYVYNVSDATNTDFLYAGGLVLIAIGAPAVRKRRPRISYSTLPFASRPSPRTSS